MPAAQHAGVMAGRACGQLPSLFFCPPIDSILRLMTVCRITWKIIRTTITLAFRLMIEFCVSYVLYCFFSVKIKFSVPLLSVYV